MQLTFEESLRQILSKGGDTDTNAAIVGGLMGAFHGFDRIPRKLQTPVLSRTLTSPGRPIAPWLCSGQVIAVADALYHCGKGVGSEIPKQN